MVSTIKPQVKSTGKRNLSVEFLRLFAAFGVIVIHVPCSTDAATTLGDFLVLICVPFFYVASITYFISNLKRNTVNETLSKMWFRILIPYIAWTVIYVSLYLVKKAMVGTSHSFAFLEVVFYGGSAVQLYYLPELVALQLLCLSLHILFSKAYLNKGVGFLLLAVPVLYLGLGYYYKCPGVTPPIAIFLILVSGFYFSSRVQNSVTNLRFVFIGLFLMLIVFYCNTIRPDIIKAFSLYQFVGIGAFMIAIGMPLSFKLPDWVAPILTVSFGIYLCHFLFLEVFVSLLKKQHIAVYYNMGNKILIAGVIFIISIAFTLVVRKIKYFKAALLGE
ncbi:acyltransferase family protein [Mucilaginibacter sp.]|uniref:acyltransferase family protein n=1 Tax=Mucilaginibacter sp. TaxID=1882438 RepID=UPI003D0ADB3E